MDETNAQNGPTEADQTEKPPQPRKWVDGVLAGGLNIQPSPFGQQVSEDSMRLIEQWQREKQSQPKAGALRMPDTTSTAAPSGMVKVSPFLVEFEPIAAPNGRPVYGPLVSRNMVIARKG